MKRLMHLAAAGVMAAAALAVLPAAPASAAPSLPDVVTVSRTVVAATGTIVTASIVCPDGYRLVGSGGGNSVILAEHPTVSFNGATIVAQVFQASPANTVFVEITCAPAGEFGDVTTSTTSFFASPGTMVRGVTRCPANTWAFGGGGYFLATGGAFLPAASSNSSNAPSADGNAWTFSGVMPATSGQMVVVTQCAPRSGHDFHNQFGPVSTNANAVTSAYADCPAGWTAVSGGFYVSNPDGTEATPASVIWSVPATHNTTVSAWYASGFAPVGTKVVALVQCLV